MHLSASPVPELPARVCVGVVTAARGLKGEVWVRSFTAIPEDIAAYGRVEDETGARTFRIKVVGRGRGKLAVSIDGITDRNAAEALKGVQLFVQRAALPALATDEFYHADLIGMAAELAANDGQHSVLGRVRGVQDHGAGSVLEVTDNEGRTMLVPFTRSAVPVVDLTQRRVVVAPLPGMLEPAGDEDSHRS